MRFGFVVPYADAREFTRLAALGERHGWDGVFTWEALWGEHAWVVLGAAAMMTERIRLGTLLTPASRWRPWDLATAVGTVDRLSNGRAVMSVGMGALHDGWTAFEPDEGRKARAEKLDECLAIYDGLMRGQPFGYQGKHYSAKPTDFNVPDPPVQRPRPPVWVVGARIAGRASQPSLDRAARWDGLLPAVIENGEHRTLAGPDEFAGLVEEVRALLAQGFSRHCKAMRSIGYKEIAAHLAGELSLAEAVELIKRDTRRYAKRQMTWFTKEKDIRWLEYPETFATMLAHVIEFFA